MDCKLTNLIIGGIGAQCVTAFHSPCGFFGGLMTKVYIRVGLSSADSETRETPARSVNTYRYAQYYDLSRPEIG